MMSKSSQLCIFECEDPSYGGDGFTGGTRGATAPFFSAMILEVQKQTPDVR